MGVRAEEPEMKVLLALTCLLAFLALALSESASHRDVELLGDQLGVRDKREAARGDKKSLKKNGLRKKKRANKNKGESASGDKKKMKKRSKKKGRRTKTTKKKRTSTGNKKKRNRGNKKRNKGNKKGKKWKKKETNKEGNR